MPVIGLFGKDGGPKVDIYSGGVTEAASSDV